MPNYCSNSVRFIGSEQDVENARQLFKDIGRKQADTDRYHMPDFVTGDDGYMSEIETDANEGWIIYETRWVPNIDVLLQIAERYELDFIAKYGEPMKGLYGEAVFTGGEVHLADLNTHLENKHTHPGLQHVRELATALLNGQQPER